LFMALTFASNPCFHSTKHLVANRPFCYSPWPHLRLCFFIIRICTSVDSDSHCSSCRSHTWSHQAPRPPWPACLSAVRLMHKHDTCDGCCTRSNP
jgi:hypothetical protein